MSDESFQTIQTREVAKALETTGHSDAARAMLRLRQRRVLPASDGYAHVVLECNEYDERLLGALTLSRPGSRSRALDDAYQLVFPWVTLPFKFHFIRRAAQKAG